MIPVRLSEVEVMYGGQGDVDLERNRNNESDRLHAKGTRRLVGH